MKKIIKNILLLISYHLAACQVAPLPKEDFTSINTQSEAEGVLNEIADRYYDFSVKKNPISVYTLDLDYADHSYLPENDRKSLEQESELQNTLYQQLMALDAELIKSHNAQIVYTILRESLETELALKVCRRELWQSISSNHGWQGDYLQLAQLQPVSSPELQAQAISRWKKIPQTIKNEVDNLKTGLALGYSMPKEIAQQTVMQLRAMINLDLFQQPFMSPAQRSTDKAFQTELATVVKELINPAIEYYVQFLEQQYIPSARESYSLLELPKGRQCYAAFLRSWNNKDIPPEEIKALGKNTVRENTNKIKSIGFELYDTRDFNTIIQKVLHDKNNLFKSEDEMKTVLSEHLKNAKEKSAIWFTTVPKNELAITPLPPQAPAGAAQYQPGEPGKFLISFKDPKQQSKGRLEVAAYHEGYPGHHLQISSWQSGHNIHPITRFSFFGSYIEGWGRYSELLAEEMGLYRHEYALISRRAWPARGIVLDTGLHLEGWSKQEVIDYILQSGAFNREFAQQIFYRSVAEPGQLTSYDVGAHEILSLRRLAQQQQGNRFDIRLFHEKILENGPLPWEALKTNILQWLSNSSG
ncbi:DUF885 domain-containing protein [Microbulbifer spongiae]|uniref:DUF885 domain-containing protein n=1 Tax=Microbulbifer spongiae TaxID=2944933 RepID=A0ABY9E603_9GAMM|nr:DUF885 domain-containing protein [Microbulbifer sp. MI-G]WKD48450.1 DUF885 domain-containing protein [Microbulbifer sp. MI-G]